MTLQENEPIDIHATLLSYAEVLTFFENLEKRGDVKSYCNATNNGGRWFFQIYNREFIDELASIISHALLETERDGPILEVMSGDGRLTELLKKSVKRDIIATDAKDGRYNIAYPKWVHTLDAMESLEMYQPSFVILSWEPYLSMSGIDIVQKEVPTAWIGNPEMCGHPEIFDRAHIAVKSKYALSRHDSFIDREFKSDIFLFNYDEAWLT